MKTCLKRILPLVLCAMIGTAFAEEDIVDENGVEPAFDGEYYVICQPEDYVVIRAKPSKNAAVRGYVSCGFTIRTDPKNVIIKNGYVYCPQIDPESDDGWVNLAYLTKDIPLEMDGTEYIVHAPKGKVQARKGINGKRRCWVKDKTIVGVSFWTPEWSVTNYGFIKSEFLEVLSDAEQENQ